MGGALIAFAISLGVSALFVQVPALSRIVTRTAQSPRWRMDAVPLAGGIAMGTGFAVGILVVGREQPGVGAISAAALVGLAAGLWDDLRPMRPMTKLAGQVAAGVTLAAFGVTFDLPGPEIVAAIVTVIWVVVAMNAVNLIDNMDGVAAGVALVAAGAVWAWWSIGSGPAPLAATLAGAAAGFLVLNFAPARLFMGDAGSHFLGAALAGLAVLDGGRAGGTLDPGVLSVIVVPAVLLAMPLFDVLLVTVERLRHGRSVSQGGADHTSHRLSRVGLSIRTVAVALWVAGAVAASVASLAAIDGPWLFVGSGSLAALALATGVWLRRYDPAVV